MNNYDVWKLNPNDFYKENTTEGKLKFLVRFGVLAPSSHNSQPWKFYIDGNQLFLAPEFKRALPKSDPSGRQLFTSLGCAIENIIIAADYYGLHPAFTLSQNAKKGATLTFEFEGSHGAEIPSNGNNLIFAIPRRHTNRSKYQDRMPPKEFLDRLMEFNGNDTRVDFIYDSNVKNAIADIVVQAMGEAMKSKGFRQELSGYIHPSNTSCPLGMPGATMGMPPLIARVAPLLLKLYNMSKVTRKQDESLLKTYTPTFGIISTRADFTQDWIRAGQMYERIALLAELAGIKTAVMAAAIEIGEHYKRLQRIGEFQMRPQVFFRMGYSEAGRVHSPRLSVEEVL